MAFIGVSNQGQTYAPGWFLAHEECVRETRTISDSGVSADSNGNKHVEMGTVFPSNDSNAIGIVYEDVDVTFGSMPGSVVTKGIVYSDRLPVALDSDARSALEGKGFTFVTTPSVTRPADGTETT